MSKERLGEIKKLDVSLLTGTKFYKHWKWLIEQAERVQELDNELQLTEKSLEGFDKAYEKEKQQNRRYREALNEIIDSTLAFADDEDHSYHAEMVAREVLESESNE